MTLLQRIEHLRAAHLRNARVWHYTAIILMYFALTASGAGGILAFLGFDKRLVGSLALLPAFIGLLATRMDVTGRSQWHDQKAAALDALARRYEYEMPQPPTPDQTALISSELTKLNERFDKMFYAKLKLQWSFTHRHGNNS